MYHNLFIRFTEGNFGGFTVQSIMNKALINIHVLSFVYINIQLLWVLKNAIDGLYGKSLFHFETERLHIVIPTMWYSGKGKSMDRVKRSGQGQRREGVMNRQSIENFQGSEYMFYDTITVESCHYTFVQNYRMSKPRVDP